MVHTVNVPRDILPNDLGHQARVDSARDSCIVTPDITSPTIVGHAWDPTAMAGAYTIAASTWRVGEDGAVPVTYETHSDMLWIVQSYYRELWRTLEETRDVAALSYRDQRDALIGAYHEAIWVRTGGCRVLTV